MFWAYHLHPWEEERDAGLPVCYHPAYVLSKSSDPMSRIYVQSPPLLLPPESWPSSSLCVSPLLIIIHFWPGSQRDLLMTNMQHSQWKSSIAFPLQFEWNLNSWPWHLRSSTFLPVSSLQPCLLPTPSHSLCPSHASFLNTPNFFSLQGLYTNMYLFFGCCFWDPFLLTFSFK